MNIVQFLKTTAEIVPVKLLRHNMRKTLFPEYSSLFFENNFLVDNKLKNIVWKVVCPSMTPY